MPDVRIIDGDIAELEQEFERGNPSWSDAQKLASLYTIKRELTKTQDVPEQQMLSYAPAQEPSRIGRLGKTEFYESIEGKPVDDVLEVFDELMDTLQVVNSRVYNSFIQKLNRL